MIVSLLIPEERKAILIGKGGGVKELLEEKTKTKITIELDVRIEGESLDVLKAQEIVKAIGRGFSPKKAFLLLDDEYQLHIISLSGENPNTIKRLFARVIGSQGKARRRVEQCSGAFISVYGKTVSIIGKPQGMEIAKKAIEQILEGRSHGYVYRRLERARQP